MLEHGGVDCRIVRPRRRRRRRAGLVARHACAADRRGSSPSVSTWPGMSRARRDADQRQHASARRRAGSAPVEPRPRPHGATVEVEDAVVAMVALAHAAHVARDAGVVRQRAEREAVIGEHDERRVRVHEREHSRRRADRRSGTSPRPRRRTARCWPASSPASPLGAEQMPEQVRDRVGALDVHHQHDRAARCATGRGRWRDSSRRSPAPI